MTDEFDFFSNDSNNWNYNPFINTPNADPYNKKRVINISRNNSYNLMKYNAVIMLKAILKHISKCLNDDVKEWIFKKALQGSKNDYWEILSITTTLLFYYFFRTEEIINSKKFVYGFVKIHYILNLMMKDLFCLQILLKIAHIARMYVKKAKCSKSRK